MSDDQFRDWDAAYVLGMLSSDDRREFERHLTTCDTCSSAVAELAGMPGILGSLSSDEAVTLSAEVDNADLPQHDPELVSRLAATVRRHRLRVRLAAGVSGVAAAAALVVGGFAIGSAHSPSPDRAATVAMTPVRPGLMTADISVSEKPWGTRFDWSCHYLNTAAWHGATPRYELVATDDDGTETVVATWTATSATTSALTASSSLPTGSIHRMEIRVAGAKLPLTTLSL